jgi:hypothetical protein
LVEATDSHEMIYVKMQLNRLFGTVFLYSAINICTMNQSFILTKVASGLSWSIEQRKVLLLSGSILSISILVYAAFKQRKKNRSAHYNSLQKIKQYRINLEKASKNKAQKKGPVY